MSEIAKKNEYLTYKGRPLLRKDDILYYGSMADKYIIQMQILESEQKGNLPVSSRVLVTLQLTDPDIKFKDRIVKKSEKKGLYTAMDVASVWLERALNQDK